MGRPVVIRVQITADFLREGDRVVESGLYVARVIPGTAVVFSDSTSIVPNSQAWNTWSKEVEFVLGE